jgi:3-phenylpropionate/cinnamic acid dioxygenase small subunit
MDTDYEQIRRLIYIYSFYVDKREFDELGALLADATFWLSWPAEGIETGEIRGEEEIKQFYSQHLAGRRPSRHVITNVVIDIDASGDTASAYAYLTSVGHPPEPPAVLLSGHYEDRFARVNGRWRFVQKACIMDLPG